MKSIWLKPLFIVAGVYDLILGFAFVFVPGSIFDFFDVAQPDYLGYVQFPGLLLFVFAAIFFRIARDPVAYRFMMWYGVWLKASYSAVAFSYYFASDLPWMWMPMAVVDLVFLLLFFAALWVTRRVVAAA